MVILQKHFLGKRVWLSGHTGFKGGWLATCLLEAGARITGFSLAPQTPFFSQLKLKNRLKHELGDLRDGGKVRKSILRCRPDFVFHLAAQPLVRDSYLHPLETYEINTLGTSHVLEALREVRHSCAAVFITTDKVYKNEEKRHAFHEEDPLGGKDPYSASKAAAEILIASYRDSFFRNHPVRIASARSGNVIGGGDYSLDRIIPDAFRALRRGRPIPVRNPRSIRPWQHVLEPLSGYLMLAEKLVKNGNDFAEAWNFGPKEIDSRPVSWIINYLSQKNPNLKWETKNILEPHESGLLLLDSSKAKSKLGWTSRWSLEIALDKTIEWHKAWMGNELMDDLSISQINFYENYKF